MSDDSVVIRPYRPEDIPQARAMAWDALDGAERRVDAEPDIPERTPAIVARGEAAALHSITHDPDGAWVAERAGAIVGCALAIRRERLWMLSLLAVAEGQQGLGLGKRLLDAALTTSEDAEAALLCSSRDPRAMRRYHQAGFRLEPGYQAEAELDRSLIPAGLAVRDGDLARDGELCAEVARSLRGSAHRVDLAFMLDRGARLLVAEDGPRRGFAVVREGTALIVAADDEALATRLAWAALADATPGKKSGLGFLTARQQWAIDVAMTARLPLRLAASVAMRGALEPFSPYLPSGIFG